MLCPIAVVRPNTNTELVRKFAPDCLIKPAQYCVSDAMYVSHDNRRHLYSVRFLRPRVGDLQAASRAQIDNCDSALAPVLLFI